MATRANVLKYCLKFLSTILICCVLFFIGIVFWQIIGNEYIHNLPNPIGGDYYTGLTYSTYFSQHLPLPPAGWLPFWNSGVPVMGGYQWFIFYPVALLSKFFTVQMSMDLISIVSLLLFFIFAHLLYFQISKNHLIALALSILTLTSQAPYYQLTAGGFITGSSVQWYLPAALFFMCRFLEHHRRTRSFLLSCVLCGISIVHHSIMGTFFVVIPTFGLLFFKFLLTRTTELKRKLAFFGTFLIVVISISTISIGPLLIHGSFSEVASRCNNSQCWGIYPYHIERWIGWVPIIFTLILLCIAIVGHVCSYTFFKKHTGIKEMLPIFLVSLLLLLYPLLSYFHLLDTLANSIFPRRMFWVVLVLILATAASSYHIIRRMNRAVGWILSLLLLLGVTATAPIIFDGQRVVIRPEFVKDPPNSVPNYVQKAILPRYFEQELGKLLNDSRIPQDENYRITSNNAGFIQWWNISSKVGSAQGYTSGFNKANFAWSYYLQTSLERSNVQLPPKLLVNRAKFLLDAFAIQTTAYADYESTIVQDTSVFKNRGTVFNYINPSDISPLIVATNAPAILFFGSENAYDSFIRALAYINFNTKKAVIVYGGMKIPRLQTADVEHFPYVVAYGFSGNVENLSEYIHAGGNALIDMGSRSALPDLKKANNFMPSDKMQIREYSSWSGVPRQDNSLTKGLTYTKFGPLRYQDNPWKMAMFNPTDIKDDTKILIEQMGNPIIVDHTSGSGRVIVSGMNLPYHIVEYTADDEIEFFSRLMHSFVSKTSTKSEYNITRGTSENITIKAVNATGILFKENFHTGWKAKANGQATKIYHASLNFMYIPLKPTGIQNVVIEYSGSTSNWIFFNTTIISLIFTVIILLSPKKSTKVLSIFMSLVLNSWSRYRPRLLKTDEHSNY